MTRSKGQKESRKHEDRLAKKIGGKRNAGSGAFWSRKGDVRSDDLLIEHKWTGKASVSVKAAVLEKIVKEAILDSRMPVLGFHLNGENYVLLTEDDFLELRQYLQECSCTKTKVQKSGVTMPNVKAWTQKCGSRQEIKIYINQLLIKPRLSALGATVCQSALLEYSAFYTQRAMMSSMEFGVALATEKEMRSEEKQRKKV